MPRLEAAVVGSKTGYGARDRHVGSVCESSNAVKMDHAIQDSAAQLKLGRRQME
jgi:hypothetical protein